MNPHTKKRYAYREAKITAYLVEHGAAPECECGCGDRVAFDSNGKPNRFINRHFKASPAIATSVRLADTIEIELIRQATRKIKDDHGWTWDVLAEKAGMSKGHVTSMMFGSAQKSVTRKWAINYFTRLAGGATHITSHQRRSIKKKEQAHRETMPL